MKYDEQGQSVQTKQEDPPRVECDRVKELVKGSSSSSPQFQNAMEMHRLGLEIMELWLTRDGIPGAERPVDRKIINRLQQCNYLDPAVMGPWPATAYASFWTARREELEEAAARGRFTDEEIRALLQSRQTSLDGTVALFGDIVHMLFRAMASEVGPCDLKKMRKSTDAKTRAAATAYDLLVLLRQRYADMVPRRVEGTKRSEEKGTNTKTNSYVLDENDYASITRLPPDEGASPPHHFLERFEQTLKDTMDTFSPENLPDIPLRFPRAAFPSEHWDVFEKMGRTDGDCIRLSVKNCPGPIGNTLKHVPESVIGPGGVDIMKGPGGREAALEMYEQERQKYGHLGGILLLLGFAGKRALNNDKVPAFIMRMLNLPVIGECFGIVEMMEEIRQLIGLEIRKLYADCGLECDKKTLFWITGGHEFMNISEQLKWDETRKNIKEMDGAIDRNRIQFRRDFHFLLENGKPAYRQIEKGTSAMRRFVKLGLQIVVERPSSSNVGGERHANPASVAQSHSKI